MKPPEKFSDVEIIRQRLNNMETVFVRERNDHKIMTAYRYAMTDVGDIPNDLNKVMCRWGEDGDYPMREAFNIERLEVVE